MSAGVPVPGRRIEVTYSAAKAWIGGALAAAVGFIAPGATYLMTVDNDGISGAEWQHAILVSLVAAAVAGPAVGGAVYATENKARTRDLGLAEDDELADPPGGSWV